MLIDYSGFDLLIYILIYSFIGWICEVAYYSVKKRYFVNRGFLNLPFNISYGVIAAVLLITLPTFNKNYILQYIAALIVIVIVRTLVDFFIHNAGKLEAFEYIDEKSLHNSIQSISVLLLALVCIIIYYVVHPVLFGFVTLLPDIIEKIIALTFVFGVTIDYLSTIIAMRTGYKGYNQEVNENNRSATQRIANKIVSSIWYRLEKTYPGITKSKVKPDKYVFAQGICFDKLIWVFLISSILGALIEMVYCFVIDGYWMNRSSVLYGPFSFVWGLGAVLLTICLRRFAGNDRKVFTAGFIIGGAYEYLCSVFTELVFGTVFWDYSNMPLNIGGRTNVWYCIAWGILSVIWVNIIYPPMSKTIEKLPALWGKIITWIIIAVMLCNGVLTTSAMIRYTARQTADKPQNIVEEFLDSQYDNEYMEKRWPNMVVTD